MICPFCKKAEVGNDPGVTIFPACKTEFKIDDRGESVFVNPKKPRLPLKGLICLECGLIQDGRQDSCFYCETIFNKTLN